MAKLYSKFLDTDKVEIYLLEAEKLADKRRSLKELCRIYNLGHNTYLNAGKAEEAKNYLGKYEKCLNEMLMLDESNCIKTFTEYNNFEIELNSVTLKSSYKSYLKLTPPKAA